MNKYFILLFLLLGCSTLKRQDSKKITSETYNGGRFGYTYTTLYIYSNDTYVFSEFVHTGRTVDDNGTLEKLNGKTYLNSTKTKTKFRKGKSSKELRFIKQEIKINGDTLLIIPKKQTSPEVIKQFYTLIRETDEDRYNYSKTNVIGQSITKEIKKNKEFKKYNEKYNNVNIAVLNNSKIPSGDFDFGIPTLFIKVPINQVHIPNFLGKYKFNVVDELKKPSKQKDNYQYFYISLLSIKEKSASVKLQYHWKENKDIHDNNTETEYIFKRKNGGWKLSKTIANTL